MLAMIPEEVKEALIALIGGCITWLSVKIRNSIVENKLKRSQDSILASGKIVNLLYEECLSLKAAKVNLAYTSNGGGLPHPGKQLYLTILYEIFNGDKLKSAWDYFQKLPCDAALIKKISRTIQEECSIYKVEDLEDGLLKHFSKEEGIDKIFLFPIISTNSQYFFIIIKWNEQSDIPPVEAVRASCIPLAEKIKSILLEFGVN